MFSERNQHKKTDIVIPYKIVQFVKTLSRIEVTKG